MILSERPEWVAEWKLIGRSSACSKNSAMVASRRRCASRSASSDTATAAPIEASAKPIQAAIVGSSAAKRSVRPLGAPVSRLIRPSQQNGLGKLGQHQRHRTETEQRHRALLAGEQAEDAAVEMEEGHEEP